MGVAVLSALTFAGAPPAGAHLCGDGSVLRAGEASTVAVGVPAEEKAVVGVDIDVPRRFELTRVSPAAGWTITRSGRHLEYRGGRVEPFGCGYVNLHGVVRRATTFAIPFVVHYEDGSEGAFRSSHLGDLDLGQMLFVQASGEAARTDREDAWWSAPSLFAAVVGGVALLWIRHRRR